MSGTSIGRLLYRAYIIREWFRLYKAQQYCLFCGTRQNIEFHHVEKKRMKINAMVRRVLSIAEIKEEISKCIPLCHACHMDIERRIKNDDIAP